MENGGFLLTTFYPNHMERHIYEQLVRRYTVLVKAAERAVGEKMDINRQTRADVMVRTMVAYRLRMDGYSLPTIGKAIGRSHSTVLLLIRQMEGILESPIYFAPEMERYNRFLDNINQCENETDNSENRKLGIWDRVLDSAPGDGELGFDGCGSGQQDEHGDQQPETADEVGPEIEPEMNEILVVIPYLAKEAQGAELELAIAGWKKHFMELHRIVVVGDWHPAVDDDEVTFINCPRIDPVEGQYLPHLDIVHKFREVRKRFPLATEFIYACDDMYAVKDFWMHDVCFPKISEQSVPEIDWRKASDWWRDLGKTRELCVDEGLPTMNWVCHLPVRYSFQALMDLILEHDGDYISYVWENIYFNFEYKMVRDFNEFAQKENHPEYLKPTPEPELVPQFGSKWKYEVKTSSPGISCVEEADAIWITNANSGWSWRLEEILRKHYGI